MAAGLPDAKALIKYNNYLEDNEEEDEEEKKPIDIEFIEQKTDPYNDESAIDFKWSNVKRGRYCSS